MLSKIKTKRVPDWHTWAISMVAPQMASYLYPLTGATFSTSQQRDRKCMDSRLYHTQCPRVSYRHPIFSRALGLSATNCKNHWEMSYIQLLRVQGHFYQAMYLVSVFQLYKDSESPAKGCILQVHHSSDYFMIKFCAQRGLSKWKKMRLSKWKSEEGCFSFIKTLIYCVYSCCVSIEFILIVNTQCVL